MRWKPKAGIEDVERQHRTPCALYEVPRRRIHEEIAPASVMPFYIFYSCFGFQRIGDLVWSAGDARARGFLLGATRDAPRFPAKACNTRTDPATCCSPPCRTALPTTPHTVTNLRSSFATACAVCSKTRKTCSITSR